MSQGNLMKSDSFWNSQQNWVTHWKQSWPHRESNTSNFHDFITFRAAASIFKNVLYNIPDVSSKKEHLSSIFIREVYQPIFSNQKAFY